VRMTGNFPQLLHAFFHVWLAGQRNNSCHTVRSYRDTWRLFLRFMAAQQQRPVAALRLDDLTASEILAFLDHSEKERNVSIGTRNCRLAALRSFFCFVADREPLAARQCAEVLRIPVKRGPRRLTCYLESEEVTAILAEPDRKTLDGQRDHALLALLFNTGARIQEALDLCPQAVRLESPCQVRLLGKGRKERICPLWPETAELLAALLQRQPRAPDEPMFVNRYGQPLGASGFSCDSTFKQPQKRCPRSPRSGCHRTPSGIQPAFIWWRLGWTLRSSAAGWVTRILTPRTCMRKQTSKPSARR
jgi:site-specific recombinase XerD